MKKVSQTKKLSQKSSEKVPKTGTFFDAIIKTNPSPVLRKGTTIYIRRHIMPKHQQEQVYEELGFNIGDANENTYMTNRKQAEQDELLAQHEAEEASGMKVKYVTSTKDENGNRLELPARLAFEDSKVNMGRLPVWYLNALGSMNEEELNDFIRTYNEELSINERIAINLLRGAKEGKKADVDRFWNLQMKMLNKTNVNMNFNMTNKPDAIVTNLLDEIANRIKDADVVAAPDEDTPTPQNF